MIKRELYGALMTDYAITRDWPDTIAFDRLHALAKRGYRATLGVSCEDENGFSRIDLAHPKMKGAFVPPKLTLWSNGIVATRELLWPLRHVSQDDGQTPGWQKFIDLTDDETFRNLVASVPLPTVLDLYVFPCARHLKVFLGRLLFGASLCVVIAGSLMLVGHLVTG